MYNIVYIRAACSAFAIQLQIYGRSVRDTYKEYTVHRPFIAILWSVL